MYAVWNITSHTDVKNINGFSTDYNIRWEVFQKEQEQIPMWHEHLMFVVKGLVWLAFL